MHKKIFLLICSLISALTLSELFVSKFFPQLTFSQAARYSFRCYLQDEYIPFTLQKNTVCDMVDRFGDFDTHATINSLGYRGKEFNIFKPSSTTRILMLGDSFTFGLGVSDEDTFSNQTEKALSRIRGNVEVVNAGYADGYSPDSYYLYFKKRGILLAPDIVIVNFFVWNDITDLSETIWEETDSDGLPEKITSCCKHVDKGVFVKKITSLQYRYHVLRESHLFQLVGNQLFTRLGWLKNPVSLRPKRDIFRECIFGGNCKDAFFNEEKESYRMITAIKKIADAHKMKFLLVLLPLNVQLYSDAWVMFGSSGLAPEERGNYIQRRIREKLTKEQIPILDLYPAFDIARNRGFPYFPHDQHFTPVGHAITAEAIFNYLQKNKYL